MSRAWHLEYLHAYLASPCMREHRPACRTLLLWQHIWRKDGFELKCAPANEWFLQLEPVLLLLLVHGGMLVSAQAVFDPAQRGAWGVRASEFYHYINMTAAHSARVIDVSLKEQFTQMKPCFSHLSWYVAVQIVISSFPVSPLPLLLARRDGALSFILKSFDWLSDSGCRHKENLQMTTKLANFNFSV